MTHTDLLRRSLDALEALQGGCTDSDDGTVEAITVWCPELIAALRAALAQPIDGFGGNLDSAFDAPAVPEGLVTAREVAREVFALCEACEDMPNGEMDSQEVERFKAGQRFAAKNIRRAIGTWLTDEELTRAAAAPDIAPAAPAVPQWLPIESAPKDRLILLAIQHGGQHRVTAAEFSTGQVASYWMVTAGWVGWARLNDAWTPTHWMPLPAAPGSAPAAPAVREPLSDLQLRNIARALPYGGDRLIATIWQTAKLFARDIELHHGIERAHGITGDSK